MTAKAFADTNIAGYLLGADPAKWAVAKAVLDQRPTISVQVVNEFISLCLKKARLEVAEAHRLAAALMARCPVVGMDADTIRDAMWIAARYGFSHWDSLIVASALQADCAVLYTEDLQHGQVLDGRLTITNPFLPSSSAPP